MAVRMTCGGCGYFGVYKSSASAEFHFPTHSCTKARAKQASARRGRARRAAVDRSPQPCLHKVARHEHGTRACAVLDKCRCPPCSRANAAVEAHRQREIAYGRWMPYVDAGPTRAHVESLRAAGMGLKQVAKASGVAHGVLSKLIYGERGMAPSRRIRWETAVRLQVVRADLDTMADRNFVDPTGTRRRVHALVATGWSQSKICTRLGMERGNFWRLMEHSEQIRVSSARAVRALYDELWETPPPEAGHRDKIAASRARRYARGRGWAPPAAWDETTIDDPSATPNVGGYDEDRVRLVLAGAVYEDDDRVLDLTVEDRLEVRRRGNTLGLTVRELAERTGIPANTYYVDTYRNRADGTAVDGRQELPPAEEITRLLEAGESIATIASRYGATTGGVEKALRRSAAA